jgi:hypothetical protein
LSVSLTCPHPSVEGEEKTVKGREGQYDIQEEINEREGKKEEKRKRKTGRLGWNS